MSKMQYLIPTEAFERAVAKGGDTYQNIADELGISRYAAKSWSFPIVYGMKSGNIEAANAVRCLEEFKEQYKWLMEEK
jgi:uncharacterized protein YgbK (DUF1537 family)